ncbi:MAG: peptide-methionine (S)-S-oxide reductase MsrA [Wenzhouxiangellaceae bacterium]|nr:peptide-methionine (S)-S-oxide reductase MsrA [Wenzhouxiangellaceae bacterium]
MIAGIRAFVAAALLANSVVLAEAAETERATFGGGCFWCMEPPFDELDGVVSTTAGYMGGDLEYPAYEQVTRGNTGHVEVVQVEFDPSVISYPKLLEIYWSNVDPLTDNRQFCDRGESYRPVIFAHDDEQTAQALVSKRQIQQSGRFEQPVIVPVEPAGRFWAAEKYHQNYYLKNPLRYRFYKFNCGRAARLEALWGSGNGLPDD